MDMNKMLIVKSPIVAAHLMMLGHELLAVEPDRRLNRSEFFFPLTATQDFNIFRRKIGDVYDAVAQRRSA